MEISSSFPLPSHPQSLDVVYETLGWPRSVQGLLLQRLRWLLVPPARTPANVHSVTCSSLLPGPLESVLNAFCLGNLHLWEYWRHTSWAVSENLLTPLI